jgi:hypothetical protein
MTVYLIACALFAPGLLLATAILGTWLVIEIGDRQIDLLVDEDEPPFTLAPSCGALGRCTQLLRGDQEGLDTRG